MATIFLDLDGVCVDWTNAVLRIYDMGLPQPPEKIPYNLDEYIGVDPEDLWTRINIRGVRWWEDLEPYPFFHEMFDSLSTLGPEVIFLTSPCISGNSCAGKVRWLKRHVGKVHDRYIITTRKELLARPDTVLIDDRVDNIRRFTAAGGHGILFPRQWNDTPHVDDNDVPRFVVERVRQVLLSAPSSG